MKRTLMVLVILSWINATASYAQTAELNFPAYVPYPPVLSPVLDKLPQGFITFMVGDETYYYSKGVFYQKVVVDNKYAVVPPPIGTVVFSIPAGFQYMLVDGQYYYVYEGVYYIRDLEGFRVVYPPLIL